VGELVFGQINTMREHPDEDYTTCWNDCTTTVSKLLRLIRKTNSHALTPDGLFNDLYGEQTGHFRVRVPTTFKNGVDYGHPLMGYDPFEMFIKSLNDASVTVTTCIKGPDGKVTCTTR
jgi:hypothetical protein